MTGLGTGYWCNRTRGEDHEKVPFGKSSYERESRGSRRREKNKSIRPTFLWRTRSERDGVGGLDSVL